MSSGGTLLALDAGCFENSVLHSVMTTHPSVLLRSVWPPWSTTCTRFSDYCLPQTRVLCIGFDLCRKNGLTLWRGTYYKITFLVTFIFLMCKQEQGKLRWITYIRWNLSKKFRIRRWSPVLIILWVLTMAALLSTLLMAFAINPTPVLILLFITSTLTFLRLLETDSSKRLRILNTVLILIWIGTFIWQTYSFISMLV